MQDSGHEAVPLKAGELRPGLLNFNFPELEGFDYGFNIYSLISGGRALLIDAAFRSQMKAVLLGLEDRRSSLSTVVLTHFHNDHAAGLMAAPGDIAVMGSPEFRRTLTKAIPQDVSPVPFDEPLIFGDFRLRFIPAPGHSPCSIFVDINGEYLHAGDNLMSRYDGRRIVPWVRREDIESHMASLELLKGMKKNRILLSHGPMIEGKSRAAEEIDMRLRYLERMIRPFPGMTMEDALPGSPEGWVCHRHFTELLQECLQENPQG